MWIYLLLSAGLFMGWSLGTNDAANAFGTAVATRVVKYRTAVIIIAIMVMIGAFVNGDNNITKLAELSNMNEVTASESAIQQALDADPEGRENALSDLRTKSALKAFIVFACAAITVFIMSYLKFPVSANQSIVGAVIGWGLCYANYGDPAIFQPNVQKLLEFASTWLLCPLGAAVISFILVFITNKFIEKRLTTLAGYDKVIKIGYIVAGAIAAYSIGTNSSASVVAFYYDITESGANLLNNATVAAVIGAAAIALGVLTFSKRVMMTVGSSIADITQVEGFVVIIAMSLTIQLLGELMGIPVSTSQAVVGAVVGAGLVKGIKTVHFGVFKNIAIAWISSPTVAGLLTYLVAICTKSYFA